MDKTVHNFDFQTKSQAVTSTILWPEEALFLVECNHLRLLLREMPGRITSAIHTLLFSVLPNISCYNNYNVNYLLSFVGHFR